MSARTWEIVALAWLAGVMGCTRLNPAFEGGDDDDGDGNGNGDDPGLTTEVSSTRGTADDPDGGASGVLEGSEVGTNGATTRGTSETGTTGEEPEGPPQVGPFGEPQDGGVSMRGAQDDDPTLTGDQLEMYFASTRQPNLGAQDIWVARREAPGEAWDEVDPVEVLNSDDRDNTPEISTDGLTMLLSSDRNGISQDIYVSTRRDRLSEWSVPVRVAALSTDSRDVCPFLSDPGQVFSCVGDRDQALVRFDPDGRTWTGPTFLDELNTSTVDCAAWLDESLLSIVFVSDRNLPRGNLDLFWATRASTADPFEGVQPIEGINTPAFEDDPWIAPDLSAIYFASNVTGDMEIYVAHRIEQ